jgi:hypothetical protein
VPQVLEVGGTFEVLSIVLKITFLRKIKYQTFGKVGICLDKYG